MTKQRAHKHRQTKTLAEKRREKHKGDRQTMITKILSDRQTKT